MKTVTSDVIIVGGGAAGMFAAAVAGELGVRVTLFERNEYLGRKLGITGKGRCNITNASTVKEIIENVPNNGRFLYSALNGFTPEDAATFFERIGIPLKTERGGRMFPVSDSAPQVVSMLRKYILSQNVRVINERVEGINIENGAVVGVHTKDTTAKANRVIVATGGLSYPKTGSTGDGYGFAENAGHTVTDLMPSLVPLETEGDVCQRMQGLSLRNVSLKILDDNNKEVYSDFGEMLFTHFGISGPLVLSASSHMRDYGNRRYTAVIDLKPALDDKKLDMRILRDFEKFSNRDFENALTELLPKKMIPVIVELSGIAPDTKVNAITREQRMKLKSLIKTFTIPIRGPRPIEDAIITSGGVSVREITPSTMESKIVRGLYFAGEVLDVDAYTGGYNLQIAWSTAYAAATDAAYAALSERK